MLCKYCNTETQNPKFCNSSCAAKFNNSNNHWRKTKGMLKGLPKCLSCGLECGKPEAKYCSKVCQQDYKLKQLVESGEASSRTLKRYLIKTYGNVCFNCKIDKWNNKEIVMELEHIDGNSENNNLDNLSLLCPNCHSQTPTFKGANKGNGRYNRRVRYTEGKSY